MASRTKKGGDAGAGKTAPPSTKAARAKSTGAKSTRAKPANAKPANAKPVDAKSTRGKPADAKPARAESTARGASPAVAPKRETKPAKASSAGRGRKRRALPSPQIATRRTEPVPSPIFLLAPPRSFTSVLCGVIGQHPELFGTPELNLFRARTMSHFISQPRLHIGLLRYVAQVYAGEQTIEAVQMARAWIRARRDLTTAEVHREICRKIAPRAMVQKSPRYHRRLSTTTRILEAFPEARFLHLLRHPRGMCLSYLDLHEETTQLLSCLDVGAIDRSGPTPIADPQIIWHDYNLRILEFEKRVHPSRWLRIVGEDLLADLDAGLKALCRWLGVSDSPEAITAMKRPEDSPFACFGPLNAMFGNDPKFLDDPALRPYKRKPQTLDEPLAWRPDQARFHPRVVEMARSFGYS